MFIAAGFKVYLDKVCIRAGHFWEEEYAFIISDICKNYYS